MDKKQLLILGGTIVAGGAAFFYLSRNGGGVAVGASPVPAGVPSMPVPSITPTPFNITDAPVYQTINFPSSRDLVQPDSPNDSCGCGGACESGLGVGAVLPKDQLDAWAAQVSNVVSRSMRAPAGVQ